MLTAFIIGCTVHIRLPRPTTTRAAPRLWTIRLSLFGLTFGFYSISIVAPAVHLPAWVTMLLVAGYNAFGIWRVVSWSGRPGWNAPHRLAVASGIIAFFFVFAPLLEFATHYPGILATLAAELLTWLLLSLFARTVKRRTLAISIPYAASERLPMAL